MFFLDTDRAALRDDPKVESGPNRKAKLDMIQ